MAYAFPLHNAYFSKNNNTNVLDSNGELIANVKLSGPEELRWNQEDSTKYYCLDLSGKYNTSSKLKQFHLVTFYFKNAQNKKGIEPIIVRAQLPKQISYSIGSEWGNPLNLGGGGDGGGLMGILQAAKGQSLATAIDATSIWMNTKPLAIQLDMPIFDDTESNSHINFQEVLEVFGRATLPILGTNGTYSTTPGPMYSTALRYRQDGANGFGSQNLADFDAYLNRKIGGDKDLDRITVQIGGMLLLDWVAIKDFTVTYPNTKAQILHRWPDNLDRKVQLVPQVATLSVKIETVTGLTFTSYKNMLNLDVANKLSESTGKAYSAEEEAKAQKRVADEEAARQQAAQQQQ